MNYFDLLNLPISYSIDLKALDKQYFALQLKYHPDRAHSETDKAQFLNTSTSINAAYKTLKNDYTRAVYILKLHHIDLENDAANYRLPHDVLEEIWDAREELQDTKDLQSFIFDKTEESKRLVADLSAAFCAASYEKAATLTIRLKYLESLIEAAKEMERLH